MKKLFSNFRKRLSDLNNWLAPKPSAPRVEFPLPPAGSSRPSAPLTEASGPAPGSTIDLPLSSVVYLLPSHLQSRLKTSQTGQTVGIPLHEVLPQLAHGDVRITFGQLRQAAPGLFAPEDDEDATLVQLPLAELASRCDPALLNYSQQFQTAPKPAISQPAPRPAAAPEPQPRIKPAVTPSAVATKTAPEPSVRNGGSGNGGSLAPANRRGVAPASDGNSSRIIPPPVAPGLTPARGEPASPPPSPSETLLVDLLPLTEAWPEALRNEIELLNLRKAQVALPKNQVSAGLKQGRLAFRWDALRSWIRPAVAPEPSAEDETELELPLQLVAPLFFAKHRDVNKPRTKVQLDEEIPEVFEMARQAPAAPEVKAAPEAKAAAVTEHEAAAAARSHGVNGASTPEQTVNRAVQLKGVAGALVTLPDGLLVASRFPENRDPEKVAAFLPQIISRLGQCIGQLEIGELNTLEFLVGNVPWKVFRSKEVLFVVLGRGGEALPSLELGILAAKLSKR